MVGWVLVNRATGETRAARCGRLSCPWCVAVEALLTAGALQLAAPERFFVVTRVGSDWQTVRARLKRLSHDIRSQGYRCSFAYTVEPNGDQERNPGAHANLLQHGDFIPARVVRAAVRRRGMGPRVSLERVRSLDLSSAYVLKMAAAAYSLKLSREAETVEQYLDLNGRRLVHASRGFWRDQDGAPLPGARVARKRAAEAVWGRGEPYQDPAGWWGSPWTLVREVA